MNNDTIDLGPLIRLLLRRWYWVAVSIIITVTIAVALTLTQPRVYRAEATVAIVPSRTEVQFDPRIQSVPDYELVGGTLQTRRAASLVAIVRSNEVVQAVLDDVDDQLAPSERNVEWLRELVELSTAGDLINIEISYPDPQVATNIANTWVSHYERHVNLLYSESVNFSNSRTSEQVETARSNYETAQEALETYERENPALLIQSDIDAELALLSSYQQARISARTRSADTNQEILNNFYLELAQTENLLANARALREQVASDTGSSAANLGNALALIILRANAYGSERPPQSNFEEGQIIAHQPSSVNIQFDLSSQELDQVNVNDVEAVITTLESRKAEVQERIATFLSQMESSESSAEAAVLNNRLSELADNVASLQSQLESANATYRELLRTRDNTWETLQLLQQKQVEENIVSEATSSEVRVADRAIVPSEPEGRGLLINALVAAIMGAVIPVSIILLDYWRMTLKREESTLDEPYPGSRPRTDHPSQGENDNASGVPEAISSS